MQLAQLKTQAETNKWTQLENRKDDRTKIQATQQSELINQRKNDSFPKDFESGNDALGGGNGNPFGM
jgi:hypothetical protein